MQIKYIKIWSFIALGIGLILLTYLIMQIWPWQRLHDIFPVLNKQFLSGREGRMPKYVATNNAYALMQSWDYQWALALISGENSADYYNRGVIKTLTAYDKASWQETSWLQLANALANEAVQDLFLAQQLQTSKKLSQAIATNLATSTELAILINAKICYVISAETLTNISGTQLDIAASMEILQQENKALQQNKFNISSECLQMRSETIQQSMDNLSTFSQILTEEESIQQNILQQKKQNPALCLQAQDMTVLDNFSKTSEAMAEFDAKHQENLAMRQAWDPQSIQQLCEAKDDSQINQGIQNAIEQLLTSLPKKFVPISDDEGAAASNEPAYIPLDEDEQELLESIDKKNKIWINELQKLKNDPEYDGILYIQTLFQEFYGNTWDFISQ